MSTTYAHSFWRWVIKVLLAAVIASWVLVLATAIVLASAINIQDAANVLNKSQVTRAGSSLAYPLSIYTANYMGSNSQFDRTARSKVSRANMIVLAVNTRGHVYSTGGSEVPLTVSQYTNASQSFASDYGRSQNFTSATVASVRTFQSMLSNSRTAAPAGGFLQGPARGGGFFGSTAFCCIGFLILIALAFFAINRRRANLGNLFNRSGTPPVGSPPTRPFNQPPGDYPPGNPSGNYPPGNYPPNAGPGYPPAQQPRQGMNPWAAGGLGAAAGGLFGYGLGKEQGERSERDVAGDTGFGNDAGGGAGFGNSRGNDAGGGGADFGNSGSGFDNNNSGGADFGGGGLGSDSGGADFGNDQNSNSGGGGSDF